MTCRDPHKAAKQFFSIVSPKRWSLLLAHIIKHSNLGQNEQLLCPPSTERHVALHGFALKQLVCEYNLK